MEAGWAEVRAVMVLAKVVGGVKTDTQMKAEQRQELAEKAGACAVLLLRVARTKGSPRIAGIHENPLLEPLRGRADFQELVREIEKNPPSQPK